jgi:phosphoribosylformylglycinamidine synthase subunit PurS
VSVVVEVMPKPEILDPQGQAVLRALHRLGFTQVAGVRQGKRFELDVEGELDDAALARVEEAARTLLANPVIEDHTVHVGLPVHDEVGGADEQTTESV